MSRIIQLKCNGFMKQTTSFQGLSYSMLILLQAIRHYKESTPTHANSDKEVIQHTLPNEILLCHHVSVY